MAELNLQKAHYLRGRLAALPGWDPVFTGPVYNEFLMRCPDPRAANDRLQAAGMMGGYEAGRHDPELAGTLLFCATEMLLKEDMDRVIAILK